MAEIEFSLTKKNKDWTPIVFVNSHPPKSDNISFFPYPPLKVDVMSVSPLLSK